MSGEASAPCPFCRQKPQLMPEDASLDGDAWAGVRCQSQNCAVQPEIEVTEEDFLIVENDHVVGPKDMPSHGQELSDWLKLRAVEKWNSEMTKVLRQTARPA